MTYWDGFEVLKCPKKTEKSSGMVKCFEDSKNLEEQPDDIMYNFDWLYSVNSLYAKSKTSQGM